MCTLAHINIIYAYRYVDTTILHLIFTLKVCSHKQKLFCSFYDLCTHLVHTNLPVSVRVNIINPNNSDNSVLVNEHTYMFPSKSISLLVSCQYILVALEDYIMVKSHVKPWPLCHGKSP